MGKKNILIVGTSAVLFNLLRHYEAAMTQPSKEKDKKKESTILDTPYPVGRPVHYSGNLYYMKKDKRKTVEAAFVLLDEKTPLEVRKAEYANLKKCFLIYIVLDLCSRSSFDDIVYIWDNELADHVEAKRIVIGYQRDDLVVVSQTEAKELAFAVCAREYLHIIEKDPTTFQHFFREQTIKKKSSAIQAHMDTNYVGCRPPFFYERLKRSHADNTLNTCNLSFGRHHFTSSSIVDDVLLGQADSKTGTAYSFSQLVEKLNKRSEFEATGCEQLLVYSSGISSFEPEVLPQNFLKSIKILVLSANELTHLKISGCDTSPDTVALEQLRELHAFDNKIKTIDPLIGQLKYLTIIDLRRNQLTELPLELFECTTLVKMDISENKITILPPELGMLKRLRVLYANNNQLTELTPEIGALRELSELYLNNNQLRELPTNLIDLPKLRILRATDNPFKDLPNHIVQGGADQIIPYLALLDKEGTRCNRMKLMLVGQENVGKTSLLRALQGVIGSGRRSQKRKPQAGGQNPELTQVSGKPLSTDGIDIHKLVLETDEEESKNADEGAPKRNEVVFSAWDFAGQEVYYSTHSFFLTERSMFVIVFSLVLGANNCRVEYWLNSIKARAPKAPIFLVGTHLDDPRVNSAKAQEEMKALQKKYRKTFKIKGVMAVSCNTLENINTLLDELAKIATKEPYFGGRIPRSYLRLEARLMTERNRREKNNMVPVIEWDEILSLAAQCDVVQPSPKTDDEIYKQEADLVRCLEILHLLGSLVYFNDPSAGLTNLVVLDPQWITKVFATIITTKQNFVRDGILVVGDLFGQVWRGFPSSLHPQLLNLLQAYEVVFRLPPDAQTPQTLHKTQSSSDFIANMADRNLQYLMQTKARLRTSTLSFSTSVDPKEKLLVPALLPDTRPDLSIIWPEYDNTVIQFTRRYEFEFMPNGLFSRFMIRLLKWTIPIRYWRTGVIVANRLNVHDKALVELDPSINRITVYVRGKSPAEFFRTLCELLYALMQNWFKVEAKTSALCPQCIAARLQDPTVFTQQECADASTSGNWFLLCQRLPDNNHIVHLEQLAPDIAMVDFVGRRVDINREVKILSELGEGAFGKVYKGEYNKEIVAVKQINLSTENEEERHRIFNEFRREVWIMSGLQHPCVVNLKGFSLTPPFSMILEFVAHGELYKYINDKEKPLDWALRLRIAWDIAKGMAFLHSAEPPLLHRDIKSPNILLAATTPDAFVVAKVADFGLTGHMFTEALKGEKSNERAVENPTWLAPEIIREEDYNTPADVYPYGIILWELIARQHPFEEYGYKWTTDLEKSIKEGVRPTIPADCPEDYANFIKACWHHDPACRPSFKAILEEWLPPLISKYCPEIKPYLEKVEEAERELSRKSAEKSKPDSEKNLINGTWVLAVDVHPERIKKAVIVAHEIWAFTFSGSVLVINADNGKLEFKFENLFAEDEVIDVVEYKDTLWVATKSHIKSINTADKRASRYPKLAGNLHVVDSKNKKKLKYVVLDERGLQVYKSKGDSSPEEELPLRTLMFDERERIPKLGGLIVRSGGKEVGLLIDTEEEANKWINALTEVNKMVSSGIPFQGPVPEALENPGAEIVGVGVSSGFLYAALNNFKIARWRISTAMNKFELISLRSDSLDRKQHITKALFLSTPEHLWMSYGTDIILLNKKTGKPVDVLRGHDGVVECMISSKDEVWSYSAGSLRFWDINTGKSTGQLPVEKPITSMIRVGQKMFIGANNSVDVWSVSKRAPESDLENRHETPVECMLTLDTKPPILYTISQSVVNVWNWVVARHSAPFSHLEQPPEKNGFLFERVSIRVFRPPNAVTALMRVAEGTAMLLLKNTVLLAIFKLHANAFIAVANGTPYNNPTYNVKMLYLASQNFTIHDRMQEVT